jgi:hypothetical protein
VGDRSEFVLQDKGLSNEKSDVTFVGGVCLRRDHVRSLFERGFSRIHPQFPHYDLRSGQGSYQEAWPDSAGHR